MFNLEIDKWCFYSRLAQEIFSCDEGYIIVQFNTSAVMLLLPFVSTASFLTW